MSEDFNNKNNCCLEKHFYTFIFTSLLNKNLTKS